MFLLKIKAVAVLAVVLVLGSAVSFVAYKTGLIGSLAGTWSMPERGLIMSELVAMKEINRLYTGSYLVPILDISYGDLKRDKTMYVLFGGLWAESPTDVPKGYCLKKYDVHFGYDNVLDLLQDETFMAQACGGEPSILPKPRLLSINSKSREINGDYQGDCRDWDLAQNQRLRQARITLELGQSEALKSINERGQKSLQSLASLLCR